MSATEMDKRLVATAIERMFQGGHLNICAIDDACKLMRVPASGPAYDRLRILHCVKWGDMPKDVMQMVPGLINELFGGPTLSVAMIPALHEGAQQLLPSVNEFDDAPPSGLRRLFRSH